MGTKNLDGLDPLSIMAFLAELKLEGCNSDVSEVMMKLVLLTFLKGNALPTFQSALHVDTVNADSAGIKTLVESVEWLLESYPMDEDIQEWHGTCSRLNKIPTRLRSLLAIAYE